MFAIILPQPRVIYPVSPSFDKQDFNEKKPIVIEFDRPIIQSVKISVSPEKNFNCIYDSHGYIWFKNRIKCYPDSTLQFDAEYSVALTNIQNIIKTRVSNPFLFNFATPPPLQNYHSCTKRKSTKF